MRQGGSREVGLELSLNSANRLQKTVKKVKKSVVIQYVFIYRAIRKCTKQRGTKCNEAWEVLQWTKRETWFSKDCPLKD